MQSKTRRNIWRQYIKGWEGRTKGRENSRFGVKKVRKQAGFEIEDQLRDDVVEKDELKLFTEKGKFIIW